MTNFYHDNDWLERCEDCEDDYDACESCRQKARLSHENSCCQFANKKTGKFVQNKNCMFGGTGSSVGTDFCSACGYKVDY